MTVLLSGRGIRKAALGLLLDSTNLWQSEAIGKSICLETWILELIQYHCDGADI